MKNSLYIAKRIGESRTDIIGERYTRGGECTLWILESFANYFECVYVFRAISDKGIYRKAKLDKAIQIQDWSAYDLVDCYDSRH